ncbi:MAG: carbon-nitrogen hydrolase family protein [bacterium]|nr:carbon-nitrogen hydrolase family protein [bacterium]
MRIALAQIVSTEDRDRNLDRALAAMDEAAAAGADLVAFAEIVLDRFFPQLPCGESSQKAADLAEPVPGPTTDSIMAKAREHGMVVVFNLYERDDRGRTFDSSPVIDADGTLLGVSRMIHITDYEGFHEQDYYHPGDTGAPVFETRAGKIGVAICYDRHYPEYMRALALAGADLVVIPQAGALGEWPDGLFEAEVRTAAFQNGYFAALCNRVGVEEKLTFAGESFAVDPDGRVIARGKRLEEDLVIADLDFAKCADSAARRLFLKDRRPELYADWVAGDL